MNLYQFRTSDSYIIARIQRVADKLMTRTYRIPSRLFQSNISHAAKVDRRIFILNFRDLF